MVIITDQPGANPEQPPNYGEQQPLAGQPPPPGYGQPPPPGYGQPYGQPYGLPPGAVPPQLTAWMPIPQEVAVGCPPGLEYLSVVDKMIVEQQVELLEALANIECANKYSINNSLNQRVYFATEESELCERICCTNSRGFTMHIWDNCGKEVMRVIRPFQCLAGCTLCAGNACCSLTIEVEAPVGQVVGRIVQTRSCLAAHFDVTSPDDNVMLKIRGPTCVCDGPCCTADQNFDIFTPDLKTEVGKISKKWSGLINEMLTNADRFGISFPMDLDVRVKATLFGALFLIDFMYFENQNNDN